MGSNTVSAMTSNDTPKEAPARRPVGRPLKPGRVPRVTAHKDFGDFGYGLRKRRKEVGMTLAALAAASGIDQSYINQVELRLANPTLELMLNLAKCVDSTLMMLLLSGSEDR